ncbi:MAG: hypothetical protein QI223_07180 [Candidatus Korarchaeota archaeon]|nr:hypothetical protein [Candidatus Korarchaeota archaeon]
MAATPARADLSRLAVGSEVQTNMRASRELSRAPGAEVRHFLIAVGELLDITDQMMGARHESEPIYVLAMRVQEVIGQVLSEPRVQRLVKRIAEGRE